MICNFLWAVVKDKKFDLQGSVQKCFDFGYKKDACLDCHSD